MVLMQKIDELVKNYINPLNYINSSKLSDSGTGYIYPSLCSEKVTRFIYQNKSGYLFQLVVTNKGDGSKKRSCFLVHCRYANDDYNVVYSGLHEIYNDCRVRQYDEQHFLERLESLLKGETINNWNRKYENYDNS